jgi:hypothetical protein
MERAQAQSGSLVKDAMGGRQPVAAFIAPRGNLAIESLASKYPFAASLLESGDVLESADCQREIEFGEEGLQVVGQALAPP